METIIQDGLCNRCLGWFKYQGFGLQPYCAKCATIRAEKAAKRKPTRRGFDNPPITPPQPV